MSSRSSARGSSASQARERVVLARLRLLHELAQKRVDEAGRGVDREQRRVAGARHAHVDDAALLLHLRGAPAGGVAVVVGDDDGVVLPALGGVDGADDDEVLLGLLARERVVGHAQMRLLVRAQAVPGAQVRDRVRVGLREEQERVEDLQRAGAVGARAVAGRGRVGLRGPEVVEREGLDDRPDEVFGYDGRFGRFGRVECERRRRGVGRRGYGAGLALQRRGDPGTGGLDEFDERRKGPRPGRRLRGRERPHVCPRPRRRRDGVRGRGAHVAVGPVEQAAQRRTGELVRRAHQVQVRAQEDRRRVREQRAAQRRRPRDVSGVERERDQQLLRAVPAQHGQVAPSAAETRLLRAQEGAHRRGAFRPGRRAAEPDRAVLRPRARPDVLGLADDVVGDEARAGLHHGARAAVVGAQRVGGRPGLGRHPPVELQDAARVGLPPAVDELVVVSDHEQPAMRAREHVHQRELGAVQVLELVHQHVVEARLDERAMRRVRQHVGDREVDLVVERLHSGRGLRPGVLRVDGRERKIEQRGVTDATRSAPRPRPAARAPRARG